MRLNAGCKIGCQQLSSSFVILKLRVWGIFETHKNPIQEKEFYGEFFDAIDYIPKTFVGEAIGYWIRYFLP